MKIKDWSKIKEGTLLIITWIDMIDQSEWLDDEVAQRYRPPICKNIGWFVNEDKNFIRFTWSVSENGDKSISIMPKGCILDVQIINYKRK